MQPTGTEYLTGLREDHARFSRVLSMIGRDARRLVDEPDAVLPLFGEAVDYVVRFQNVYHHPREEIMFAKVAAESAELATVADNLSREHEATATVGNELLALMWRVSNEAADRSDRDELAHRLERFARSMRGHIAQEEEILYAHAWDHLTAEDWDALADSAAAIDPLEESGQDRYPLLAEYVAEGRTESRVAMASSPVEALLEVGLNQASAIYRTFTRQGREACALSRKTLRDMPMLPLLEPRTAVRVGVESAGAFGRAYVRWLREWGKLYRNADDG